MRQAYAPLVWQCRYGGIEVPDALWHYAETGHGRKYSDNQAEDLSRYPSALAEFDTWGQRVVQFVSAKGRITPGTHRAFGYKAPGHLTQDLQLFSGATGECGLAFRAKAPPRSFSRLLV